MADRRGDNVIREAENEVMWLQVRECGQLPGGRNKKPSALKVPEGK